MGKPQIKECGCVLGSFGWVLEWCSEHRLGKSKPKSQQKRHWDADPYAPGSPFEHGCLNCQKCPEGEQCEWCKEIVNQDHQLERKKRQLEDRDNRLKAMKKRVRILQQKIKRERRP